MADQTSSNARGSGADADAILAAAVGLALAIAEQAELPATPATASAGTALNPWLLDGRRRLMDSRGRPSR
jgi:hypothetical protein